MSVKIETSASDGTLRSLDPLKVTTDSVHLFRMVVELQDTKQWYAIIKEANRCFGLGNWYGQPKIKRRLDRNVWTKTMVGTRVWFDVPEREFASWIGVKFGIKVISVS